MFMCSSTVFHLFIGLTHLVFLFYSRSTLLTHSYDSIISFIHKSTLNHFSDPLILLSQMTITLYKDFKLRGVIFIKLIKLTYMRLNTNTSNQYISQPFFSIFFNPPKYLSFLILLSIRCFKFRNK